MIQFLSKNKILLIFLIFLSIFLLTSCSTESTEEKLLEKIIPQNITGFWSFIKTYIILQLSIFINSLFIGIFLGRLGYFISLIGHFIWIIVYRDFGFFIVLLLFSFTAIIRLLLIFVGILLAKND